MIKVYSGKHPEEIVRKAQAENQRIVKWHAMAYGGQFVLVVEVAVTEGPSQMAGMIDSLRERGIDA